MGGREWPIKEEQTQECGRTCIASRDIVNGELILDAEPFASVILQPFQRQVCGWCYTYGYGSPNLKYILRGCIRFCSPQCRELWERFYENTCLLEALEAIERARRRKKPEEARPGQCLGNKTITSQVDLDEIWNALDFSGAPKLTSLDDTGLFDVGRFVASTLAGIARHLQMGDYGRMQSNEVQVSRSFPDLLNGYCQLYLFLRSILPAPLLELCTTDNVRSILGKEAANAFGIWELPLSAESEQLGYGIYPSASFFNHGNSSLSQRVTNTRLSLQCPKTAPWSVHAALRQPGYCKRRDAQYQLWTSRIKKRSAPRQAPPRVVL